MCKVSIIVPNYNHAAFLAQRIDSILAQSYTDFELIIMDDCSTDASKEVIDRYRSHERVTRIVLNARNSGSTFRQWNKGIAMAKGNLVWIAESDDYSAPDFLEKMVLLLESHPSAGFAYCQSYRVNEKNEVIGDWFHHTSAMGGDRWLREFVANDDALRMHFGYHNIVPNASSVLFSRKVLLETGGASEDFILNGDWHLYIKILMQGYALGYLPDRLNYFREHSVKVTRKAVAQGYHVLEAFRLLDFMLRKKRYLSAAHRSEMTRHYCQHYLPQIFEPAVSKSVRRNALSLAFRISPLETLRCLRHNRKKTTI